MMRDRRFRVITRPPVIQGQPVQPRQESSGVNPVLILAAAGGILLLVSSRRPSKNEFATLEAPLIPGTGPSIPLVDYALAGTIGYLSGKAIEALLSSDVTRETPATPPPSKITPMAPIQGLTRAGRLDLTALLAAPYSKAISTPIAASTPASPIWTPPSDYQWLSLIRHPAVVLTIGRRDAGKSALDYRLLELLRGHGDPYVVGLPAQAQKGLPEWMGFRDNLEDVPQGAVVLLDESHLQLHSRTSMTEVGRSIGNLINLSRQKRQTLLFVVQEARQLDINIVSQIDVLAVKELSELSKGYERPQLRQLTDKARAAFATVHGDKRKWTWVYAEASNFEGLVKNELPSFWAARLSHAYAQPASGPTASPRRGKRLSREEMKTEAKKIHAAGLSYAHIARALGISKTKAWNLIKES